VTATVNDGNAADNIDSKSATINVAANKPPVITGMFVPATAAYGKDRAFSAFAYDPDYGTITYAWTATCGTLANAATSTPTWTAPNTPDTSCNVTLTVSDGTANVSQTKAVTTTTNNAPVISSATGPASVSVNGTAQFTGTATDSDGDRLSWTWTKKAGSGSLTGTCSGSGTGTVTGTCSYLAPATDETATLTFSVSDGIVTTTRDVSVNVTSVTGGFGVTVR
jgi:hypothetical protein